MLRANIVEFKYSHHYNEILRRCREDNEAVIITVNGRGGQNYRLPI